MRLLLAEVRVGLRRTRRTAGFLTFAGLGLSGASVWHALSTDGTTLSAIAPAIWAIAVLLYLATASGLVSDDLRTGAVGYWIQKPVGWGAHFCRRLLAGIALFLVGQSLLAFASVLPLLAVEPAQAGPLLQVFAMVTLSLIPLFGPAFALSALASRFDAAGSLALALFVAPPILALTGGTAPWVQTTTQLWVHPWVHLDAISMSLAGGSPFPIGSSISILASLATWTAVSFLILTRRFES